MRVNLSVDLSVETDDILKERELKKAFDEYIKEANKRSRTFKVTESKILKVKSK